MRNTFLLLVIFVLGATLRFWSLGYDLPNVYNLDEPYIMTKAVAVADGNLRHGVVIRGSLPYYTVGGAIFLAGTFLPNLRLNGSFQQMYEKNRTPFYVIGRSISAAFSSIDILLVFLISNFLGGPFVGILAAFFTSVSTLSIQSAHVVYPDAHLVTTMLLVTLITLRAYQKRSFSLFVIASFGSGLAAAQKLPGLLILPLVLLFYLSSSYHNAQLIMLRILRLVILFIAPLVAYIMTNPFIFSDIRGLLAQWQFEMSNRTWWDQAPYPDFGYIQRLSSITYWLQTGTGSFLFLFAFIGIIIAFRNRKIPYLVLASVALLFFSTAPLPVQVYENRVVPLVPFVALFTALSIDAAKQLFEKKFQILFMSIFILIIATAPLLKSVVTAFSYAAQDTRTELKEWMVKSGIEDTHVLRDPYTGDESHAILDPANGIYGPERVRMFSKIDPSHWMDYDFVITSTLYYQRFFAWEHMTDNPAMKNVADIYRKLFTEGTKIIDFQPILTDTGIEDLVFLRNVKNSFGQQTRGPTISVYKLPSP